MESTYDWDRQEELESLSRHWGRVRFSRRLRKAQEDGEGTRVGAARTLLKDAVARTTFVIEEWTKDPKSRRHVARRWIDMVGPELAAYVTCRNVLGCLETGGMPILQASNGITDMLLDELRAQRFRERAPGLFEYRMASFQTTSRVHMARSLRATMAKAQCTECHRAGIETCSHLSTDDLVIAQGDRAKLGVFLIRCLQEAFPGWLEKETMAKHTFPGSPRSRVTKDSVLVATEQAREWLAYRNEILAELTPVAVPMVVPPLPWGPGELGGYRFDLRGKYPFVRATRKHQAVLAKADMPLVYEAVNRIQETPWRINHRVLEVVEELERRGGAMAGLPSLEPVPLPERPASWDTEEPSPQALHSWKARKTHAIALEQERLEQARRFVTLKSVIGLVEEEEAIWFPHNLDFRGRVYPIGAYLTPQGDDLARGLLEFADGEELGARGQYWIAIHGANCLGETPGGEKVSQMTLQERFVWIYNHEERIVATGRDPLADLWWMDADEPWQFLAFCFAWEEAHRDGRPHAYVCHLPVSLDGACNGLQHFAAMLRDERAAKSVNVFPNARPNDVYSDVASRVLDLLQRDAAAGNDLAVRWLGSGLVNRKLCKRPTMTFGYGSKPFGMTYQLIEYLRLDVDGWLQVMEDHFTATGENGDPYPVYRQASQYLAGLLWEALSHVVQSAFDALGWMQACARVISKSGRAVEWTVPETGFPVLQDQTRYYASRGVRIRTYLAGEVLYRPIHYERIPNKPDAIRQANAVAPNVVHSLDAAALQLAVTMANHDGVEHFAMIHDSYGCLPSQMDALLRATRTAFFHLYSRHDVVEELYHEWLNLAEDPAELPEPPCLGDLDVSCVLGSDYFFA